MKAKDAPSQLDAGNTSTTLGAFASQPMEQIATSFAVDLSVGLTAELAATRLKQVGPNCMTGFKSRSPSDILIDQFKSSVVVLLLVASAISGFSHEYMQMVGILAAVVINAVIGFITEYRALVSLRALEALSGPLARIRRGGVEMELAASELVPGDLVLLDAGSRVPADMRLFQAASLAIDESILTGESVPAYKDIVPHESGMESIAHQGTVVVSGRGRGVVVATGDSTRLGKLGQKLCSISLSTTPLERNLEHLGSALSTMTVVICVVLFGVGCIQHRDLFQMLQISISLAVAAIPEGLPVVATLALALGTQRMVKLNALIRKLSAVETLGCTQIICTDKTGTLTQNQMSVSEIVIGGRTINVSGSGYAPTGDLSEVGNRLDLATEPVLTQLLMAVALCNDARVEKHLDESSWHVLGDPTEGALVTVAAKAGLHQNHLKQTYPRLNELPFDMTRKRMTTVHALADKKITAFVKGSPESTLAVSTAYLSDDGVRPLDSEMMTYFKLKNQELAHSGKRTLAVAMRHLSGHSDLSADETESDLIFLGLVAMSDRLKDGVKEAIAECQAAGIRVIMLTGDQVATASAIAKELGISRPGHNLTLTDADFNEMNSTEKSSALSQVSVLARTEPDTKLAIVQSLQALGKVVAMTGDGVNDAAALRQADIGVAMGQGATALAREASDMVITDDAFNTIVKAIEQGRAIYTNIARAIAYLITASLTSVLAVTLLVVANQSMVLTPLQLLWLNLIMHVFPGLGIVLQKASPTVMQVPPRRPTDRLLGRYQITKIILRALLIAALSFVAATLLGHGQNAPSGTVLLATLSGSLLLQSWSWLCAGDPGQLKSWAQILPRIWAQILPKNWHIIKGLAINWAMLVTTVIGLALLLVAIYLPPLALVLETRALAAFELGYVLVFCLISFVISIMLGLWVNKSSDN
ncbi:MAG: cation-transporting P-type ATPase [Candidatus Obscuribacter sp.]|nr:cation-transporting P-type ATPase [Candidatus Obscuribacter sp.]